MTQWEYGAALVGLLIDNRAYADAIYELANSSQKLQPRAGQHCYATKTFGTEINVRKTKVMIAARNELNCPPIIMISGRQAETTGHFMHLGILLFLDNFHSSEVKHRLALVSSVFRRLAKLWEINHLSIKLKIILFKSQAISTVMYELKTRTLENEDERKLLAFEMRCLRHVAIIKCTDRITNDKHCP